MAAIETNRSSVVSKEIAYYLEQQGVSVPTELSLAGQAASSRLYYRIPSESMSYVLMQAPEVDSDFNRFIEITHLLQKSGVRVPELYVVNSDDAQILIEDLGTVTLWDNWQHLQDADQFKRAIDALILLQNTPITVDMISEPKVFDQEMLEWETGYFTENYLTVYECLSDSERRNHRCECIDLARSVDAHKKVFMHRDFQSQNIMISENEVVLIDYQGARMGSYCYDLASLVWDPYCSHSIEMVDQLVRYYYKTAHIELSYAHFYKEFIEASLQRVMQACGAYSFLSDTKGKVEYKKHLQPGLLVLKTILSQCESVPTLKSILSR
ncbi:MAG: phosphotransferase [Fibrobacterales bacterium]